MGLGLGAARVLALCYSQAILPGKEGALGNTFGKIKSVWDDLRIKVYRGGQRDDVVHIL